jgi:hypothetical protein
MFAVPNPEFIRQRQRGVSVYETVAAANSRPCLTTLRDAHAKVFRLDRDSRPCFRDGSRPVRAK